MERKYSIIWLCTSLLWVFGGSSVYGEDALSDLQKNAIEQLFEEYLKSHPEIILESVRNFREKQEADRREQGASNLKALRNNLERDPQTPEVGNPQGDVTIVEFFDYNCGYCKSVLATVRQLLSEDSGVRLVLKEYPILSEGSKFAARAALAAGEQGRYFEFHNILMELRGQVTEERVLKAAVGVGLDVPKLERDMEKPEILSQIESNRKLAQSLNINGTPTFVVGDEIIPGAVDRETLRQLVGQVRRDG